jgi:hypothetical protein
VNFNMVKSAALGNETFHVNALHTSIGSVASAVLNIHPQRTFKLWVQNRKGTAQTYIVVVTLGLKKV